MSSRSENNTQSSNFDISNSNISSSTNKELSGVMNLYNLGFNQCSYLDELFINFDINKMVSLENYIEYVRPSTKLENEAVPYMIDHIKKYIDTSKYEIKDVKDNNEFRFSISLTNSNINGRPDAVIIPINRTDLTLQVRVCFEFKTKKTINKPNQRKLELIASYITSFHPTMVVQTDLDTFYLLVAYDNKIYELISKDAKKSIECINYWLNNMCDSSPSFPYDTILDSSHKLYAYTKMMLSFRIQDSVFRKRQHELKFIDNLYYSEIFYEQATTEEDKKKVEKILNVYYSKKMKKIEIPGRSGKVYKIQIDNEQYALKLHEITRGSKKDILAEMKNEKSIYDLLKNKEGNWPILYYGGFIRTNKSIYYAICTNYIDGNCYTTEKFKTLQPNELNKLKELSLKTIKSFHSNEISHGDIRPSNFIFKDDEAYLIDFGFAEINGKRYYDFDLYKLNGN
jgi:tRNA A-37 threonylcarbamoyl transferase component Bud32